MTKPSQTQIQQLISSFLTLRGSRLLPPLLVSHPTGGRGNMFSVHFKVHSVLHAHGVTHVASLNVTSEQVVTIELLSDHNWRAVFHTFAHSQQQYEMLSSCTFSDVLHSFIRRLIWR